MAMRILTLPQRADRCRSRRCASGWIVGVSAARDPSSSSTTSSTTCPQKISSAASRPRQSDRIVERDLRRWRLSRAGRCADRSTDRKDALATCRDRESDVRRPRRVGTIRRESEYFRASRKRCKSRLRIRRSRPRPRSQRGPRLLPGRKSFGRIPTLICAGQPSGGLILKSMPSTVRLPLVDVLSAIKKFIGGLPTKAATNSLCGRSKIS